MNPITHLLSGWALASLVKLERRDRALVTIAGVIPDLDGFGLPFEMLTATSAHPLTWWSDFHHTLGHNIGFALLTTGIAAILSKRKLLTTALVFVSFHIHLLEDLVGARGPDGHQWPIPYLLPFSSRWQLVWQGQWALNAWPNFVLTVILLAAMFYCAWKRGNSPLELLSARADAAFVRILRRRFGEADRSRRKSRRDPELP